MNHEVLLFGVVTVAILIAAFARKRGLSAPLLILAFGLAESFIPELGKIQPSSGVILGLVLPPLLYSAALSSSYQDFRTSFAPILRLGVGLVVITATAVAFTAYFIDPKLSLAAGFLLGAMVAPPDAVAAAAVGNRLGLPRRVMTLLSGESLINDATSLTLYKVALAAAATSGSLWREGLVTFALAVVVGIATGIVLGLGLQWLRSHLHDPTIDTALGFLLPFASYWVAEELHGSGVLAVVTMGFLVGHNAPKASVSTRLHEESIWSMADMILESFVFAIIGIQLKSVIVETSRDGHLLLSFALAGAVLAVCMAIRPAYIYVTEWAGRHEALMAAIQHGLGTIFVPKKVRQRMKQSREEHNTVKPVTPRLSVRELFIVSWAGMRGVVTLAAAWAITATDRPFPEEYTIQLAAYTVAIGTLLIQGLTLPALIKSMNITNRDEESDDAAEEAALRLRMGEVAAQIVTQHSAEWEKTMGKETADIVARQAAEIVMAREAAATTLLAKESDMSNTEVMRAIEDSVHSVMEDFPPTTKPLSPSVPRPAGSAPHPTAATPASAPSTAPAAPSAPPIRTPLQKRRLRTSAAGVVASPDLTIEITNLRKEMIHAQRALIVKDRDAGRVNEAVMRRVIRELDLEEESMNASWASRI